MSVRFGLLALLAEQPTHGYQLKTAFERRTGGSWALNIGQVYTTLQRLERDGFVRAERRLGDAAQATDGDAPAGDRTDYRITTSGKEQLDEWFASPVVPDGPARDELTIKVLLAIAASDVDVTAVLQRQRSATLALLQAYTRRKAQADPELDVAWLMLLDALIFKAEAEVRWLDACEARIQRHAGRN
ncbi:MAG: PadR family transcriptional regulator [Chloroflexota bacterium]|nr:PadR family transcriptional regulator [Chloroflexota bacterium]